MRSHLQGGTIMTKFEKFLKDEIDVDELVGNIKSEEEENSEKKKKKKSKKKKSKKKKDTGGSG